MLVPWLIIACVQCLETPKISHPQPLSRSPTHSASHNLMPSLGVVYYRWKGYICTLLCIKKINQKWKHWKPFTFLNRWRFKPPKTAQPPCRRGGKGDIFDCLVHGAVMYQSTSAAGMYYAFYECSIIFLLILLSFHLTLHKFIGNVIQLCRFTAYKVFLV